MVLREAPIGSYCGRNWGLWEDSWCLEGDFNVIRFLEELIKKKKKKEIVEERNREGRITGDMRRFFQVIDDLEVKEIPL